MKYKPKLIKDLGTRRTKSGRKVRYGKFECGECKKSYIVQMASGSRKRGMCRSCASTTHGKNGSKIYLIWVRMRNRCYNKRDRVYPMYGGRGIKVHTHWINDFNAFYKWFKTLGINESKLGKGNHQLTIDRKDVNGDYVPDNLRFVKPTIQSRNTRVIHTHNTSGYRGVSLSYRSYKTIITVNNRKIRIKISKSKLEAMQVYDKYVDKHNLEHSKNNLELVKIIFLNPFIDKPKDYRMEYNISGVMTKLFNNDEIYINLLKRSELSSIEIKRLKLFIREIKKDYKLDGCYIVVEQAYPIMKLNIHTKL